MRIKIAWNQQELFGTLEDTPTTRVLADALPHTSKANTWGEEVYFSLPIETQREPNADDVVEPGTICYWLEGRSVALAYGPTPISEGEECRLAAPCNILGKLEGDPRSLAAINDGDEITVSRADGA